MAPITQEFIFKLFNLRICTCLILRVFLRLGWREDDNFEAQLGFGGRWGENANYRVEPEINSP